jgi:hypothetical protein
MRFSPSCRLLPFVLALWIVLAMPALARAEAPHLASSPTITGGSSPPIPGDELTGHNGGWWCNPGPCTKTTFQWFHCSAGTSIGCVANTDILLDNHYTVQPSDVGFSLVLTVTTWNYDCNITGTYCHDSSTSANSDPTAAIGSGLAVSPPTLPAATSGVAYNQTLSTSVSGATWSVTVGALPPGLTLTAGGVLAGTPRFAGSFTFTVKAVGSGSAGAATYTLVVKYPTVLVSPDQLFPATPGIFYSQPFVATGGAAPYTFVMGGGSLPDGLTVGSDGTLSGVVTGMAGLYQFTLSITDANGAPSTKRYFLQVATPTILVTSLALPIATAGTRYIEHLGAAGGTEPYTFSLADGVLPSGMSLSPDGTLSGTPLNAGTYLISVKVVDANGVTITQTLRLVVQKGAPTVTKKRPTAPKKKAKAKHH